MAEEDFQISLEDQINIREEKEEKRVKRKTAFTRAELTLVSYLQNNGPSTTEDIVASAPLAHILEEVLYGLQSRGLVVEEDGYWRVQTKNYHPKKD